MGGQPGRRVAGGRPARAGRVVRRAGRRLGRRVWDQEDRKGQGEGQGSSYCALGNTIRRRTRWPADRTAGSERYAGSVRETRPRGKGRPTTGGALYGVASRGARRYDPSDLSGNAPARGLVSFRPRVGCPPRSFWSPSRTRVRRALVSASGSCGSGAPVGADRRRAIEYRTADRGAYRIGRFMS